jgi:L,D-transpeptidase ErfK/SrfK
MDWKTPLGTARIAHKQVKPSWHPPQSVIEEARAAGSEPPPNVVPPGPDNPLGEYALRLSLPGYLIHGTNKPWGVGMRVTHGCIRLLPEHIEQLFGRVAVGTPVHLVNQPVKVGWYGNTLFIEVHPPLEEDQDIAADLLRFALERVYAAITAHPVRLDGSALREAVAQARGIPVPISTGTGHTLENPMFR